jgi:SAM-dependent methyltransferase
MERHAVFVTDRIQVTEQLIASSRANSVLEIGAGDYSFSYLKRNPEIKWESVDFNPPCDVICDLNNENVKLPLPSDTYDMVICTEVLEHLLWPQMLLKEVHRVLSDKGILIASVPNCVSLTYRIAWLLGKIPSCAANGNLPTICGGGGTTYTTSSGGTVGGHVIDFNYKRLDTLLNYCNFNITTLKGSGLIWYRQLMPHWSIPPTLSSNLIFLAKKKISPEKNL